MESWKYPGCLHDISERLIPDSDERGRVESLARRVREAVWEAVVELGYDRHVVDVEYQGSFAKDTWLPGELDLDLFVLFDKGVGEELLEGMCREIAYGAARRLGAGVVRRYASHPYYTLVLGGVEVDVVPAYHIRSAWEMRSAVDRTPLHTRYVTGVFEINPGLRGEVRMFKRLLKNLKIYGADQSVGGFSGYLAELLIIHYGSLVNLLFHASKWRPWETRIGEWHGKAPLVVVDPVDPRRNAAAAVGVEAMSKLIGFATLFRLRPELLCCALERRGVAGADAGTIREALSRGAYAFIHVTGYPEVPRDVLAGMLGRVSRKIVRAAEGAGFRVLRSRVFVGEDVILAFHLESATLSRYTVHTGPPVWGKGSLEFLERWISEGVWPYISDGRWQVVRERRVRSFVELVEKVLSSGGHGMKWRVYEGPSLLETMSPKLLSEIYEWATGREAWLTCIKDLFLRK